MRDWQITYGDKSWTDRDALVAHVVAVAELIGDTWDAVSPWSGPRSLAAWVAVLVAADTGNLDQAVRDVYGMPVTDLADCLSDRPVVSPVAAAA